MIALSNLDLFEELFNYIQNGNTLEDTLKEFGGTNYYIPSYKTTSRNDEIIKEYKEHFGKTGLTKILSKKYSLSERQILTITKSVREEKQKA